MKVSVDEWLCAGHGLCEAAAPDVFEVNDEGIADVTDPNPAEALWPAVREGARLCPADAVLIDEDDA
ncbi:ferredoxin [Pseudonocardia kongjuensis]|uniref:Ferredoxin n=1 Tax=Pseudonocardia kongjuensis TaxID=102227 RepID=A0ABN1XL96_9PSEU